MDTGSLMDIEDIYGLLPEFQCTPGCTVCCRKFGVPSRTKVEDEKIKEFVREKGIEVVWQPKSTCCAYVSEQGCTIYPVRPLICRLYGTSPNYLCIMGVRPLELLHEDQEAEIFHLYQTHFS